MRFLRPSWLTDWNCLAWCDVAKTDIAKPSWNAFSQYFLFFLQCFLLINHIFQYFNVFSMYILYVQCIIDVHSMFWNISIICPNDSFSLSYSHTPILEMLLHLKQLNAHRKCPSWNFGLIIYFTFLSSCSSIYGHLGIRNTILFEFLKNLGGWGWGHTESALHAIPTYVEISKPM